MGRVSKKLATTYTNKWDFIFFILYIWENSLKTFIWTLKSDSYESRKATNGTESRDNVLLMHAPDQIERMSTVHQVVSSPKRL
ncbi:MAG: hypothetical protein DRN07_04025 [Thermoplasmata archaeon]|nr:MAG: hypothetical protein DRN07_04025 [Thermoplasmata archaeon]